MKKLLVLCSMGIMAMSIASCTGKETKINYQEGNEILNNATDKTLATIKEVANGDFIGVGLQASANAAINLEIVDVSNVSTSIPVLHTIKAAVEANGEMKYNVPVSDLKKELADCSNLETYSSASASANIKLDETETTQTKSITTYTKNNVIKTKEDNKEIVVEECTPIEMQSVAESILDTVDKFKDIETAIGNSNSSLPINPSDFEDISIKWNDFTTGKITASELIDYVNTVVGNDIFENAEPGAKDCVISMLNILKDASPDKYFNYTKVTNKNNKVLSSSFNYSQWKTDLLAGFDKEIAAIKVPSSPVGVLLVSFKTTISGLLPSSLSMDYTLTMDKNNLITGIDFTYKINGALPTYILATILSLTGIELPIIPEDVNLASTLINYDVSISGSVQAEIKNTSVVVPTL